MQLLYGDDLIRQSQDSANEKYYLYDGLGSTRALTDLTGAITDTYNYEAFGSTLNQTGTTPNNYLFTGEQYDQTLNQQYLRARYYDPHTARFTQQDTWMGNNQDPITLHKYLYANVDPVNNIDPSGNFSLGSLGATINTIGTLANIASSTYNLYSLATGDEEITATQIGFEILAGMGGGKLIKMFSKKFKKCRVGNSFTEGMLISTPDGLVPIETIKIGDYVYSYDERTGEVVEEEVIHLIQGHKEHEIVSIKTIDDEIISATDGHPFYISENNGEWLSAENLKVGDKLLNSDKEWISVVELLSEIKNEKVYNLTVDNSHTYFVGEQKLLAHNSTCRIPHRAPPKMEEESWKHIHKRHIHGGDAPQKQGDLFAPGTTRDQIEFAAKKLVGSGKRQSSPNNPRQVFEKRMVINGKRAQYRIIVEADSSKIISMFPIGK